MDGVATHGAHAAGNFFDRLAFDAQGGQKRTYLGRGCLAGHDFVHHRLCLIGGEMLARYEMGDCFAYHGFLPRKQKTPRPKGREVSWCHPDLAEIDEPIPSPSFLITVESRVRILASPLSPPCSQFHSPSCSATGISPPHPARGVP